MLRVNTYWLVAVLLGCSAPEIAPSGMDFVAGGVIVDGSIGASGRQLRDGKVLVERDWSEGETVRVVGSEGQLEGVGPGQPGCVPLFHHDLGAVATGKIGFSGDGTVIALHPARVGDRVVVLDAWRGMALSVPPPQPQPAQSALPKRCASGEPVVAVHAAPDGRRFAVVEGPIGGTGLYRLTVVR